MMEGRLFMLFSVASLITTSISSTKLFRSDYTYNRKADAFYKLHIETTTASRAKEVCAVEGAELMLPSSMLDIQQVHAMFKQFPDLGNLVLVGDDGGKYRSAEEQPENNLENEDTKFNFNPEFNFQSHYFTRHNCDAITRSGEVATILCAMALPFVCKVEAKNAPYDRRCNVYCKDYHHFDETGSCYKIPRIDYSWNEAYDECQMEGAHLLVINSEAESRLIQNITKTTPAIRSSASYFFHVGIRANRPTDNSTIVFRTVFNETLEMAGFSQWSENEPNNYNNNEYCGTVFAGNGKYNDINCQHGLGFICEKEVLVSSS